MQARIPVHLSPATIPTIVSLLTCTHMTSGVGRSMPNLNVTLSFLWLRAWLSCILCTGAWC